jgi:hypothetical protein
MPKLVASGAQIRCSEGLASSQLSLTPAATVELGGVSAATVQNRLPFLNIAPFGMCKTQANPQVAAATAAAMGVLTPMPCIPVVLAPWTPGATTVELSGDKVLTDDSRCSCLWTGEITVTDPASDVEAG